MDFNAELQRCLLPLGEAYSLPAHTYTDESFFYWEKRSSFEEQWFCLGLAKEIPNCGDYVLKDIYDHKLILLRDEQQQLRAYSRICRHRAMDMAACPTLAKKNSKSDISADKGNIEKITCPFHRWSYEINNGQLNHTPHAQLSTQHKKSSLPEYRLHEWQGFVFININGQAGAFSTQLQALEKQLSQADISRYAIHQSSAKTSNQGNWKLAMEIAMESYHHIGAHFNSFQKISRASSTYVDHGNQRYAALINPYCKNIDRSHGPIKLDLFPPSSIEQHYQGFVYYALFPNLLIGTMGGFFDINIIYPTDKDSHRVEAFLLVPEGEDDNPDIETIFQQFNIIEQEDQALMQAWIKGLTSAQAPQGPLTKLEKANWLFYQYLLSSLVVNKNTNSRMQEA
ncbi:SRPBCC family protein [Dasania marina]|mgnify:CR=1 FL=1|uniref:aromatic ring-hydroxylating oxygenase subunit alpha n=1 Tax=Dasania marina TaxID=471499 RepID=UPI0030DB7B2E|tara:strand:- start:6730 stop:7920 length:1191 start_codon:yes stop_codon:yes gene_type:complete